MAAAMDIPFLSGFMTMDATNRGREAQQLQQVGQFASLQSALEDAPLKRELLRAQVDETRQKAAKLKRMDALFERVQAGSGGKMSPDQLEQVGQFLALGGHDGAATVINMAEGQRKLASNAAEMQGLRSQTVVDAPAATEAEAVERINAGGGAPMSIGIGENPNIIPRKDGGLFAPLMQSPNKAIALRAKMMQEVMDKAGDRADPQFFIKQADALAAQNAQFEERQAGRQFGVDNRPAQAPQRAPIGHRFTADGGSLERIPVVGANGATAGPTDDALTDDAWFSIINGKARPGSLPIGRDEGNAYRAKLREKISSIARDVGLSPERLATLGPENKAKFGALSANQKDLAAIRPYEKMLDMNVNVAIDLAKKIERTDSQFLNKPITWLMQNASDNADIAEYLFQIQTVSTEGARILNNPRLVGPLTDSARHEMQQVINGNMPLGQTERVLKRMLSDGRNRVKALEEENNTLRDDIRGSAGTPKGPTKEPAEIENAVKAAGYAYEPDKYDYRVGAGGRVQRKPK